MQTIHLNSPWFELVRDGKKKYEGRRKTALTDSYQIGSLLEVRHYIDKTIEPFTVCVQERLLFQTFEEALNTLDVQEVLPIEGITVQKGIDIYQQYVSMATQLKEGIVMLRLSKNPASYQAASYPLDRKFLKT